jgi:flagellar hook-associated protein 2
MSDTIRMTGLYSGMDTESIISALVSTKSEKVTTLKNEQKKLGWKQTMWQELNSKIYSFYSKTLSNMRLTGDYAKKTTKISDSTKASIVASGSAVNGTQTLEIKSIAKSGYLTGARIDKTVSSLSGKVPNSQQTAIDKMEGIKLTDLSVNKEDDASTSGGDGSFVEDDIITLTCGSNTMTIEVDGTTTVGSLISQINSEGAAKGFSASYDKSTGNLSISGSDTSSDSELKISIQRKATDGTNNYSELTGEAKTNALKALGLDGDVETSKSQSYTTSSTLANINSDLAGKTITVTTGKGDSATTTDIELTGTMTISELVKQFQSAGLNASFDETNQRFFISSKSTGEANDFELSVNGSSSTSETSKKVLSELGLYAEPASTTSTGTTSTTSKNSNYATKVAGSDAMIILNGAEFTSTTNTFSINGLTITTSALTADNEPITITTETDYDGIYDMIKDFVSEYNSIINDIYQKYNADSARKYSMLTDDEKEAMTDDEVEEWEDTIKSALLRKDTTLQTLMSSIVNVMNDSYGTDSNGNKRYLFTYGIETLGYFESEEGERYALHIAGDPDDENTSDDDDLLKTAIINDPEGTIDFFTSLAKKLYDTLNTAMGATDYSSIYKVYDDKRLQTEYDDYTDKISDAEDELSDYEDYWYSKFSSMETALSKLQSTQSVVSSMLGTS